ncbi:hypothetical protein ACFW0S_26830 [Citrobacter freundii]|uniref:hypothetical protein n=1 Tax=Citrobacter freundii TaxID=546 RepID=UPI00366AA755
MPDQFKMERTQHVSFTKEEAEIIDKGREITSRFTKDPVSVNKYVKTNAVERAKEIIESGKK